MVVGTHWACSALPWGRWAQQSDQQARQGLGTSCLAPVGAVDRVPRPAPCQTRLTGAFLALQPGLWGPAGHGPAPPWVAFPPGTLAPQL